MFLKYITIYNFRGIEKLETLEIGNLNTFVGKNDSGKSSILRALDCFFDEKKFDMKDIYKGIREGERTIIQMSFIPLHEIDDLALDGEKLITIKKEFYTDEKEKIKLESFYLTNDFENEEYQDLWNKKEQDLNDIISNKLKLEPEKSGRGKKNLVRINQIKNNLKSEKRKETYHYIGDFLKNIENNYEIKLPEYSLFDAEQDLNIQATNFQSQFKHIILSYFDNIKEKTKDIEMGLKDDLAKEFEEIRKIMSKNVSDLKGLNPTTDFNWAKSLNKFDLNLEFEGQNFDVPISHKGTGFKRLLMVAYFEFLSNKKSISNQIFAIEEPETYLHPSAQENLLDSIIKISNNSQFFITTHSPIFAGSSNGENSILVTKNESGASEYQKGIDIVEKIIKELGIKPDYNLLKNTKFLIFVEGKDDIFFLQNASRKLLNVDLEEKGILCVIGGGSSLKNYADLDLFKKLSNGKNYAVFVDGDNGDLTKDKEKENIKIQCDSDKSLFFRLSKRDIENYCCPDIIKSCFIMEIIEKEGEKSQNPNIQRIKELEIEINDDTDVEECLKGIGINNFKNGLNLKVFQNMTKEDYERIDAKSELKTFFELIFKCID